jgi:D-alanine-D-alanine ligase
MKHITVLTGGASTERAVSLRSGKAVADALTATGYAVTMADPQDGIQHIGTSDTVFIALHGAGGEDGTVQRQLRARGIAYTGPGVGASELCFNKARYKQLLAEHTIHVPQSQTVTASTVWDAPLLRQPFVLKPVDGGSSIDTFIMRDPSLVDREAVNMALAKYPTMLLEELITGTEITVGILGETALPVIEIIPPADTEFDYENKYNGKTQELCPPPHVSPEQQKQAQELALRIHRLTSCEDMSRTDMILTPNGKLVVLETNTIPGLTDQSLYPKAAAAAGISMQQLVDTLAKQASAKA